MIASSDRLWLSFGSGLLAAVNPCGFVLLPTYLMYFLGVSGRPGTQRSTVRRALGECGAVCRLHDHLRDCWRYQSTVY